ncbi:MAG: radical SAM protein, partial [Candidatus Omnitrophica bacterium]|nr:radical SAM protein [Candidatus Omnitrophota bacterium]
MDSLIVNEIYLSLQGESSWAGLPCIFVRLTFCNLRCSYCDTAYAFTDGQKLSIAEIKERIRALAKPYAGQAAEPRLPLVEITGGEPLLQSGSIALMSLLCDAGFVVLLETNGAIDIAPVDPRVHRIMDLKCPSSGESERNRWANIACLKRTDEVKFVLGTDEDYRWAKQTLAQYQLCAICP